MLPPPITKKENMPNNTYAFVKEFHETFRAAVGNQPSLSTSFEELRYKLILEEALETLSAIMSSDNIEFADGLGDLDYVIEGAAITFGITLDEGFEYAMELHSKFKYYELLGLLVLGVKDLGDWLRGDIDYSDDVRLEYVRADLSSLKAIVWTIANMGGLPLGEVVAAIHESNMSKLDADGHPIFREDGKILKGPNYFTPTAKIKELLDA